MFTRGLFQRIVMNLIIGCFFVGAVVNIAVVIYKKSKVESKPIEKSVDSIPNLKPIASKTIGKHYYDAIIKNDETSVGKPCVLELGTEFHKKMIYGIGDTRNIHYPPRKSSKDKFNISKYDFFQFNNGSYTIRILPNPNGGRFWESADQHYLSKDNVVQCRNSYPAEYPLTDRCPTCKHHNLLQNTLTVCEVRQINILEDRIRRCKPTKRYYYNILVMSECGKTFDPTPKMFSASEIFHKKLIERIEVKPNDITDLNTGNNVVISKSSTDTTVFISDFRTPVANDCKPFATNNSIISQTYDLKEVIKTWDKPNDFHFLKLRNADVGYLQNSYQC